MVTFPCEWKILERNVKPQTNKQTEGINNRYWIVFHRKCWFIRYHYFIITCTVPNVLYLGTIAAVMCFRIVDRSVWETARHPIPGRILKHSGGTAEIHWWVVFLSTTKCSLVCLFDNFVFHRTNKIYWVKGLPSVWSWTTLVVVGILFADYFLLHQKSFFATNLCRTIQYFSCATCFLFLNDSAYKNSTVTLTYEKVREKIGTNNLIIISW